jgi:hypothetical protein
MSEAEVREAARELKSEKYLAEVAAWWNKKWW